MSSIRLLGIFLVLAGFLGFGFSGVADSYDLQAGLIELGERVRISEWLSAGAIGGGLLMLMFERRTA